MAEDLGAGDSAAGGGNFRGFDPSQPHGAVFWIGSNSALNAEPYALRGQPQEQPPSGSNRFGITFMSEPYLPHLTKPSGKDTIFLTLSGTRASTLSDQYATVPTDEERAGNIPGLAPITPVPQATALLTCPNPFETGANCRPFFPEPNLPGDIQNYHLLTAAQTNTSQAGMRYLRSLGKNATLPGGRGGGRRSQNQGLRQTINFNYNWIGTALDNVNIFPQLGGKSATNSNSLQAGYTVGYHKFTNIFNANWNHAASRATNFFTNVDDIATTIGILGPSSIPLNSSPFDYGLPDVVLSNLTGLSEQQPNLSIAQTISLSETLSWIYGKHNMRFGGDYRRVHRDFRGGSNTTGTFYFTGAFSGSSLGDFLLGKPEETSIDSAISKSYLRDNVMDLYAQDDWRVLPILTLNYGVRYEFYAPYTEKYGHLADVDTNPDAAFSGVKEVEAGGVGEFSGKLPNALVYPFRTAIAPRLGLALQAAQAICLASRLRHQLHRGPVRHSRHDDGASAALRQRAEQRSQRMPFRARRLPHVPEWISDTGHDRQLRARSALSSALCADVESGCAEDHALERGAEHRLQRIEGQSSGRHHRAATKRNQLRHRSQKPDLQLRAGGGFFKVQSGNAAREQAAEQGDFAGSQLPVLPFHRRCRFGRRNFDSSGAELAGPQG